jgi:Tol biopolymer transport system component
MADNPRLTPGLEWDNYGIMKLLVFVFCTAALVSSAADRIMRRVENDFEVYTVRPDGKDVKRLTHSKGNDAHLNWSPDGERILFATTRMGFKDEALYTRSPQPYGELFVMRFDGTQVEQITDNQWEDAGPLGSRRNKIPAVRLDPRMAGLKILPGSDGLR